MNLSKNENFSCFGTINKKSYESIGMFILSERYKIIFYAFVLLFWIGFGVLTILQHDLVWLVFPGIVTLTAIWYMNWNSKNVLNRVIATTPEIRDGKSFVLDISFDDDAIRVHNRQTGLDTALGYDLFGSYIITPECIVLFVKTGTYLMIPSYNMKDEKKTELINYLKTKCRFLHKRHF